MQKTLASAPLGDERCSLTQNLKCLFSRKGLFSRCLGLQNPLLHLGLKLKAGRFKRVSDPKLESSPHVLDRVSMPPVCYHGSGSRQRPEHKNQQGRCRRHGSAEMLLIGRARLMGSAFRRRTYASGWGWTVGESMLGSSMLRASRLSASDTSLKNSLYASLTFSSELSCIR